MRGFKEIGSKFFYKKVKQDSYISYKLLDLNIAVCTFHKNPIHYNQYKHSDT